MRCGMRTVGKGLSELQRIKAENPYSYSLEKVKEEERLKVVEDECGVKDGCGVE